MSLSKATKQFSDDDLITCGICYIEMEHPRSLVCLHTYCLGCLREWSKHSKNELICPVCREPTPLPPDGVDGLRSNFLVTKLKDRKAVSRQLMDKDVKIACTSCDVSDDNEALARCFECNDFLCDSCLKAHKTLRLTKNHSMLTLVELRSGKVSLQKKSKDDHCREHAGQVMWFYCKSCDVPICRDCTVVEHPPGSHELVKIDKAIIGQREEIQELSKSCKVKKEEVDEAFEKIQQMWTNFKSTRSAVNMAIDEKKERVKKSLEKEADDLKNTVDVILCVREKAAAAHKDELQILNSRLKTALDMASHVTREGSDYDIASVYKNLTTTLQQLGQITAPSIHLGNVRFHEESSIKASQGCIGTITDSEITHIKIRNMVKWNAPWKMVRKFGETGEGMLKDAKGVAVDQDGDVAVADHSASRVYVYGIESGKLKMSIDTEQSLHSNPTNYSSYPHGVVVYQGHYIVTDRTYFPTVYKKEKYIRQIPITRNKDSNSMGIAVNSQGHVLVGHLSAAFLEIHSYTDGKQIASLDIPIIARHIAISSSDDETVITNDDSSYGVVGAYVVDSQGHTIHVLRPPSDVTSGWSPSGVCTIGEGDEEEIFICNRLGKPGVYRFSLTTGKYLGCVTTEVSDPRDIAFTEDERLVVADKTCVKVFAPPE